MTKNESQIAIFTRATIC